MAVVRREWDDQGEKLRLATWSSDKSNNCEVQAS